MKYQAIENWDKESQIAQTGIVQLSSLSFNLNSTERYDSAQHLTGSTHDPVCRRHHSKLWSLGKGKEGRGEEIWSENWLMWGRLERWKIGFSLEVPRRKCKSWPASRNSPTGTKLLLLLFLLHSVRDTLLLLLHLDLHHHKIKPYS